MPTREERTLKLIKGANAGAAVRNGPRRSFTRHLPPPDEPVEKLLKAVDDAPAGGAEPAPDATAAPAADAVSPADAASPADGVSPADAVSPAGAAPPSAGTATGSSRRRRLLVGLLLTALAAALAAAGVAGHQWYADRSLDAAHQAALAAAKQTAVNFVSVSAASVDRDLQRISAGATGEFKEQFTRGEPQVRAAIVENKVESRGTVLRAGLVSGDRRSAVVLVAVDATVKNVKAPEGRPSHYRIQVDLVRDEGSGAWLVSRLQFVG